MIKDYKDKHPQIHESCFVASDAVVIGEVSLAKDSSVWFGSVIRGDMDEILIGEGTNIQDNCTLHTDPNHRMHIGKRVTIGHNAIVHGACIEDDVLIGMGATILNGARIGKGSIIGAGALIVEHQVVPAGSVVVGCPGKVIKQISEQQYADNLDNASHYIELAKEYKALGFCAK